MSAAILPCLRASRISPAVVASSNVVGMLANLLAHGVDLYQGAVHGFGAGHFAGDPDGKENRAEIAFAHARNVDAARRAARAKIEFAVEKTLRRVVVRIHDDRGKMQLARFLGNAVRLHCTRQGHAGGNARAHAQNRSHHLTLLVLLLSRLQFPADFLRLLHHAKNVAARESCEYLLPSSPCAAALR